MSREAKHSRRQQHVLDRRGFLGAPGSRLLCLISVAVGWRTL